MLPDKTAHKSRNRLHFFPLAFPGGVPGKQIPQEVIMDSSFWLQKWEKNDIAFHGSEANPLLIQFFKKMLLKEGSRIFLPLCGKTLDIAWLLSNGYRVAGAELSKVAIEQLFDELGLDPKISRVGKLDHYCANDIDIFVGDIFHLTNETLGSVNAIYDRAALVALPKEIRNRYAAHLTEITNNVPQLLICYEYDQKLMDGPPFSVSESELRQHYCSVYNVTLLASTNVAGGLKGICAAKENVWLLK